MASCVAIVLDQVRCLIGFACGRVSIVWPAHTGSRGVGETLDSRLCARRLYQAARTCESCWPQRTYDRTTQHNGEGETAETDVGKYVLDTGRDLLDGFERSLPGGSARASSNCGRFLDGST